MRNTSTTKRGKRLVISVMIDEDQVKQFDSIAGRRRTTRSALAREALDLFLSVNRHEIDINNVPNIKVESEIR